MVGQNSFISQNDKSSDDLQLFNRAIGNGLSNRIGKNDTTSRSVAIAIRFVAVNQKIASAEHILSAIRCQWQRQNSNARLFANWSNFVQSYGYRAFVLVRCTAGIISAISLLSRVAVAETLTTKSKFAGAYLVNVFAS